MPKPAKLTSSTSKPFYGINQTKDVIAKHKQAIRLADYSKRLQTQDTLWKRVITEGFQRNYVDDLVKELPTANEAARIQILNQLTGIATLDHYLNQVTIRGETASMSIEAAENTLASMTEEYYEEMSDEGKQL